jgi:hypothetical protein
MARKYWGLSLVVAAGLAANWLAAAEEGGQRGGRSGRRVPYTLEQIAERLGADNALNDEQKKKIQAVNDEFTKKIEEASKKPEVAAAQKEMEKARESGDRDAMRAAFKKVSEAMGFNTYDDYKKALGAILTKPQAAKVFPPRQGGDRKTEQK